MSLMNTFAAWGVSQTLAAQVSAILRKYGADAHVYLPGIGVINGFTAGNYLDSAGTTPATVDNPVGLVVDANGTINATQATTANKPILRRGAVNLLLQSNNILNTPWTLIAGATRAAGQITFAASASSAIENLCLIPGGTANKTITVAAKVSCSSGTVPFRLKNSQGGVVDNLSPELLATTTPTVFVFTVTNGASAGSSQNFGITNSAVTPVVNTLNFEIAGVFIGTYTADSLISSGGLVATTTAPASSSTGNYSWQFDGTNDTLQCSSSLFDNTGTDYAYVIGLKPAIDSNRRPFFVRDASTNIIGLALNTSGLISAQHFVGGVSSVAELTASYVANETFVASVVRVGASLKLRKNGIVLASATPAAGSNAISANMYIGSQQGSALFFQGSIHPTIAIKGTITDADLLMLDKFVGLLSGVTF